MNVYSRQLTDLIGSRICHDLISPIGAISNGVELIAMSGDLSGPEMNLISESVANANARIRFFRIAFGTARPGQTVNISEITGILRDLSRGGRVVTDWQPKENLQRQNVKLTFLLLQCFETAMPSGGKLTISTVGDQWAVFGQAEQMKIDDALWQHLPEPGSALDLEPAQVHFALAPLTAQAMGRRLIVETSANSARVRF
ncbi:MAG: histidine phosphotransferase family protein [Paracoccaceae bacterium]